jgi:hypothetical protein
MISEKFYIKKIHIFKVFFEIFFVILYWYYIVLFVSTKIGVI